jgi:hypothetical protein
VRLHADLDAPCPPDVLFHWVEDLTRYPSWLEIVPRARLDDDTADGTADGSPDASPDAWIVDLRGRLGPLARSKRLRMVRTVYEAPHRVRFERAERDGREHSPWVLEAEVVATPDGQSRLQMDLDYGGSFGGRLLERMVRDEIERSRPRLLALVQQP